MKTFFKKNSGLKILLVILFLFFSADIVSAQVPFKQIDEVRVKEIEKMLPELPQGFGFSYKNRDAWGKVKAKVDYEGLIQKAEAVLVSEMPAWNDSLYLIFSKNGERVDGQKMIGDRVSRLYPLVWAECFENKGRFVPKIEETLKKLISHRSWVYPAHDRSLDVFYGRKPNVDLLAAGFAQTLSQSLFFLGDKLSPQIRKEVTDSMFVRIFNPVLEVLETEKGGCSWLNSTGNWNAVCLSGVTGAALGAIADKHLRAYFVAAAEYYSQNYVSGFTGDGYCSEGIGYFNYGFGHFAELREIVFQNTGGSLDFFADEKIKKMAMYGLNFEIINGVYPAFADCHLGTVVGHNILWYCNQNLQLGLTGFDYPEIKGNLNPMILFPNTAEMESSPPGLPSESTNKKSIRTYFDQAGVLICRPFAEGDSSMGVALKGGHNDEHHNHNDVGSYSLVVGNETIAGEPGGPEFYNGDMFVGAKRYTRFKRHSSYGHPVPYINKSAQPAGAEARANVAQTNFTDGQDEFTLDLKPAYHNIPELEKLTRRFVYDRTGNGTLLIDDRFAFISPGEFESAITFYGDWKFSENGILEITGEKAKVEIQISVPENCTYTVVADDIEEYGKKFTRLGIRLNEKTGNGFVRLFFKVI